MKLFQGLLNLLQLVGEPQDLSLGGLRLGFALRLVLKGRVEQGAAVTRGSRFSVKSSVKREVDIMQKGLLYSWTASIGYSLVLQYFLE